MSKLSGWSSLAQTRRTEVAVALSFLTLIVVVGLSAWRSAAKGSELFTAVDQARYHAIVVEKLESVIGDITEAESHQRGYLLTADKSYLTAYDAALVNIRAGFEGLLNLTSADANMRSRLLELRQLTEKRLVYLGHSIDYYRTGNERQARDAMSIGGPLASAIRSRFVEIQPMYQAALSEASKKAQTLREDVVESFLVTSALAAAVLVFMVAVVIVEVRRVRTLTRRLLHESRHDNLTGLPNRAYLNESLHRGIATAKRAGEKLALVYINLNGFKHVNDQHGYQAGDEVLIDVAKKLGMITRGSDFVGRLGGDEFAVIMSRVNERKQIEAGVARFARLAVKKGSYVIDASVGYAVYPDDTDSAEGLIKLSDAAMYERKQQRNQR